jgi:hypothetical protein
MKHVLTTILGLSLASLACAQQQPEFGDRRLKVLEDPLSVRFSGDPQKTSKAKMKEAIDIAALAKDWKVKKSDDGRFELETTKNNKHVLRVNVTYGDGFCQIHYMSSVDMMYKEMVDRGRDVRVIHGNYNVWIRELAGAIGSRIGEPVTVSAPAAPPPVVADAPANPNGNFYSRSDRRGARGGGGAVASVPLVHSRVVPQPSGYAAIDDVDKVPVREAGKDVYRRYLTLATPKAFAVTEDGSWKMVGRDPNAIALVLDHCEQLKKGCWLYAVDAHVVFDTDPGKRISQVTQVPRAH